jgi:hypothetical protein
MHLLAASAGGGLLVGVGIRLAESRHSGASPARSNHTHRASDDVGDRLSPFLARLESLEKRICSYTQADGAEPVEVDRTTSLDLVVAQMGEMEKRLRQDLEQRHGERLDQLTDALEKRLGHRIAPIEAEMENQRTAVGELREFSLRTETSLQKLLEGIEKLVTAQTASKTQETVPSGVAS